MSTESNPLTDLDPEGLRLARIGYEAYGKTTDFKNYQGLPMPPFDNLPSKIIEAWVNASLAIRAESRTKVIASFMPGG